MLTFSMTFSSVYGGKKARTQVLKLARLAAKCDHMTLVSIVPVRTPGSPVRKAVGASMASGAEDSGGGASSRRCRVGSHTHSHSHSHGRNFVQQHSNSEPAGDVADSSQEFAEPSTSVSELRYLYYWLQKSLPFLIILSCKLVIQHAVGEYETLAPASWKSLNQSPPELMVFLNFRFVSWARPLYKLSVRQ